MAVTKGDIMTQPRFLTLSLVAGLFILPLACAPLDESADAPGAATQPQNQDLQNLGHPRSPGDPILSQQESCLDRCTAGYDRCLRKGASRPDPGPLDGRLQCATDYSECAKACLD
jgi:hypothetical protein